MRESDRLAAGERRVLGVFLLLLGAGLILDCHSLWVGGMLLGGGALAFASGIRMERHRPVSLTAPAPAPAEPQS